MCRPSISLLVSALSLAGLFNTALAETSVRVAFVKGDAKLLAANGIERAVKKGDVIKPGEKIITAPGCTLQAFVNKTGIIAIRPDTHVLFEKLDPTKINLRLIKGNVRVHNGLERAMDSKMVIELTTLNGRVPIRNADNETVFIPKEAAPANSAGESGMYTRFTTGSGSLVTSSSNLDLSTNQIGRIGDASKSLPVLIASGDLGVFDVGRTNSSFADKQSNPVLPEIALPSKQLSTLPSGDKITARNVDDSS